MNYTEKQTLLSSAIKAVDYLTEILQRDTAPKDEALVGLKEFNEEMPLTGYDPLQTIEFLNRFGSPATMASNAGRYFGFVIGGSHTASLAANWLASAWDQNAGLGITSPVNARIESVTEKWLTEILPVAEGSSVGFVTGVTMANFCGLAAARSAILHNLDWNVEAYGLYGAPRITVVISEEAHGSLLKALSMLGLGMDRVVRVPTDENGRMRMDSLPPLDNRTILCLQAGNVNSGAMDDGKIIAKAKEAGAWVHIDGAFGLWAGASELKKHLTQGYKLADSWATDGHKWLNVPYDNGLIICRNGEHLRRAMSMSGDYLDQSGDRIPYQYTPELSRRARAIDIWAALRTLGKAGIDDLVTRTCVYAEFIADRLKQEGFEILNQVETNQVLVHFNTDDETNRVIREVQQDGTCWCSGTVWKDRVAMRISISSYKTTDLDIRKSLEAIVHVAKGHVAVVK
ncbi:MAG: aspartate aminotransferase family protein [Cyclobacteriaceae bacterium]|nr:aspartate aminotransferase family protein [Cyclobacteriaceae bacterium]